MLLPERKLCGLLQVFSSLGSSPLRTYNRHQVRANLIAHTRVTQMTKKSQGVPCQVHVCHRVDTIKGMFANRAQAWRTYRWVRALMPHATRYTGD